jgi:hypothetical protein
MKQIILVSCVSKKLDRSAPAADLYQSVWFKKARRYAEQFADRWYILSAHQGLLASTDVVEPYDVTLNQMLGVRRQRWAQGVFENLIQIIDPAQDKIVLLAGKSYRTYLARWLKRVGYTVDIPLQRMGIGQQLRWLNEQIQDT